MRELVEQTAASRQLSSENRSWALDTLAFWDIADDDLDKAQRHVDAVTMLLKYNQLSHWARSAYAVKLLLIAARREERKGLRKAIRRCKKMGLDEASWRVARYNYAVRLHFCGEHDRAVEIVGDLALEYFDVLGIELGEVFGNLPKVAARIGNLVETGDDLRCLADCLDLQAKALLESGEESRFCRIHAPKLYVLAEALSSAVKVGQDFVDESLRVRSDPERAYVF